MRWRGQAFLAVSLSVSCDSLPRIVRFLQLDVSITQGYPITLVLLHFPARQIFCFPWDRGSHVHDVILMRLAGVAHQP